jgi:cbb3-type cytochrome oxidase subunit 1
MEMQQFHYDNKIVRNFIYASIVFGVVGMLVGLLLALMFLFPNQPARQPQSLLLTVGYAVQQRE